MIYINFFEEYKEGVSETLELTNFDEALTVNFAVDVA